MFIQFKDRVGLNYVIRNLLCKFFVGQYLHSEHSRILFQMSNPQSSLFLLFMLPYYACLMLKIICLLPFLVPILTNFHVRKRLETF